MRALVQDRYGPPAEVLHLEELADPTPAKDEVCVRVHAASICGDDWHLLRGLPYVGRLAMGLRRPKQRTPGLDLAGVVESVGSTVTTLKPGDAVFGWGPGALAERCCTKATSLAPLPEGLSFEQAAVLPVSGMTALQAVRDAGGVGSETPGQRVLINGASGGVGSLAVQIAKHAGAHVTGTCSAANLAFVRELGADAVIDYRQEDVTSSELRPWDVIIDLAQSRPLAATRRALTPTGTLVMVGSSAMHDLRGRHRWFKGTDRWIKAMLLSLVSRQRLRPLVHQDRREDLLALKSLVEQGALRPLIDRGFALNEVVEALSYTAERRGARGIVSVRVATDGTEASATPDPRAS